MSLATAERTLQRNTAIRRATVSYKLRLQRPVIRLAVALGYTMMFLIYAPIIWLAVLSFSARPLTGLPWPLSLRWYDELFAGDLPWLEPMRQSVLIGIVVAVLTTGAATGVGRVLPRLRRRIPLLLSYLSVLFLPGIVIGVAILMYYRALLGIRTGLWSIILAHFVWAFPFALLCILLVATRFDIRLLEAAKDLGATRWQQFCHIEFPLLKPGVVASLFFSFLLSFNELPRTIYVRGPETTLPYYIWTQSAAHSSQVSLIYALSAIIMMVSLSLTAVAISLLMREE
jgi:ABC-type spermidine/putrescine transport system permease subunit II